MRNISLLLFFVISVISTAQDFHLSQNYSSALWVNPAFTGLYEAPHISASYRVQWPDLPKPLNASLFSADYYFKDYNSAIGIVGGFNSISTSGFSESGANLYYSYKIDLNPQWIGRGGLSLGYWNRGVKNDNLVFGDQLDVLQPSDIGSTSELLESIAPIRYLDVGTGITLMSEQYWFGVSAAHLNRPKVNLYDLDSRLAIKYQVQMGTKIAIDQGRLKHKKKENSMFLFTHYYRQGAFSQLQTGVQWFFQPLILGGYYRGIPGIKASTDAYSILLGLDIESVTFAYSQDMPISGLRGTVGISREISVAYRFYKYKTLGKAIKTKGLINPCPKF